MTRLPSTMMPKSIAPRLSRLAGMPARCMQMNANSSDSGIVTAVRSAARTLPSVSDKHDDDDDERFGQRAGDRAQRVGDQLRAIVNRHDPHASGRRLAFRSSTASWIAAQHLAGVLPAPHQHDAFHAADAIVQRRRCPVCGAAPIDTRLMSRNRTGTPSLAFERDVLDVRHATESSRRRGRPSPAGRCSPARRRRCDCSSRRPARPRRSSAGISRARADRPQSDTA